MFKTQKGISQIVIVIIIAVLVIAGTGGGIYYWQNKKVKNLEKQISDLNKQIEELKGKEVETKCDVEIPIISFTPSTFTVSEKKDLLDKVINPFIDYHNMIDNPDDPMIYVGIEKNSDQEVKEMGYLYQINYVTKKLGWGGWLERKSGETIKYWTPECMDNECNFTDEFEAKHPKTVEEYNKLPK